MHRVANIASSGAGQRRRYVSPLRRARAEDTRRRILRAVVATMARGLTEVSVPAVAREAGVSTRTVYRHFTTKADLVAALGAFLYSSEDLDKIPPPRSLGEIEPAIRELFRRLDAVDPVARAALLTRDGWEARRATVPRRLGLIREGLMAARPGLDATALEHMSRLALILTSSFSLQAWKDYLGLDADEAAAEVAWALRAALAGAATG